MCGVSKYRDTLCKPPIELRRRFGQDPEEGARNNWVQHYVSGRPRDEVHQVL